jgi:glycosyltransferase involved in cell wall biosynthesis
MKIGIAAFGCDGGRSGIGQYLIQLLRGFVACGRDDEFELLALNEDREVFAAGAGERCLAISDRLRHPLVNLLWHQVSLPVWCWRRGYDVLFIAAGNRRLPYALPCPAVGTVHDLAPVHVAEKYDRIHQVYVGKVLPRLVRRLSHVITVSKCSRDDVVRFAGVPPERITVIHNGVDHEAYRPAADRGAARAEVARLFGVDRPYLLYVSRLEHPGKNHVRLIEAFSRLKERRRLPHVLVLAGPDRERAEEVHDAARRSPAGEDIVFTGFTAGEHLPLLYQAADAFVMPSLYEGFGIPILEAMACATPVICSRRGAMPEVAGDAAMLVDPESVESLESALGRVSADRELREALVARGLRRAAAFHWRKTAEQTLDTLHFAAQERRSLQPCKA